VKHILDAIRLNSLHLKKITRKKKCGT